MGHSFGARGLLRYRAFTCASIRSSVSSDGAARESVPEVLIAGRNSGTLRLVRNGQLLERDIPAVPEVFADSDRAGLMDIAVNPDDERSPVL